jgi:hypothetical protein
MQSVIKIKKHAAKMQAEKLVLKVQKLNHVTKTKSLSLKKKQNNLGQTKFKKPPLQVAFLFA